MLPCMHENLHFFIKKYTLGGLRPALIYVLLKNQVIKITYYIQIGYSFEFLFSPRPSSCFRFSCFLGFASKVVVAVVVVVVVEASLVEVVLGFIAVVVVMVGVVLVVFPSLKAVVVVVVVIAVLVLLLEVVVVVVVVVVVLVQPAEAV